MSRKKIQEIHKTEEQIKAEALARRDDEARREVLAKPKTELQKKRENYWYHYKWHTIGGVFAAVLLGFFLRDYFQPRPDATIIMIGGGYVASETTEMLAEMLGPIAGDYNGDAKNLISVDPMTIPANDGGGADAQMEYATTMKIVAVVAANSDPIYLLDSAGLAYLTNMSGEDGSGGSIFDQASVPVPAEILAALPELEGYRFYLRDNGDAKKAEYMAWCREFLENIRGCGEP